jgi:hypothetical protein
MNAGRIALFIVVVAHLLAVIWCQGHDHSTPPSSNQAGEGRGQSPSHTDNWYGSTEAEDGFDEKTETSPNNNPSPTYSHTEESPSKETEAGLTPSTESGHTEDHSTQPTNPDPHNNQNVRLDPTCSQAENDTSENYTISYGDSMSLVDIAQRACNQDRSLTIHLNTSSLQLNETAKFNNVSKVAILGQNTQIYCMAPEAGIQVINSTHIQLEDVSFQGCGSTLNATLMFRAALHISECHTVTLRHVTITHSNGTALNLQCNTGDVVVEYSDFTNNTIVETERNHLVGGGVIVYITSSVTQKSKYQFTNCTFARNKAAGINYDFILSTPSGSSTQGRGGGVRVTIASKVKEVQVLVINCRFEDNMGFLGAGMSARIDEMGNGNAVIVRDTTFTRNGCQGGTMHTGIGGGIYLSFEGLRRNNNSNTGYVFNVTRTTFDSNCAEVGGGTYFFSDPSRTDATVNKVEFHECKWQNNHAHTGSAADVSPNIFRRAEKGFLPTPLFRNCEFINNTVHPRNSIYRRRYGSGTVHASLSSIEFQVNILFRDNLGSAVVIVNGVANFTHSNATFTRNRGIQGGAILLIGTASMIVGGGYNYTFKENKATDRGGAIHSYLVDDTDIFVSRSCFIQYRHPSKDKTIRSTRNWTASLVFEGNEANIGESIFATSVIPCKVTGTSGSSNSTSIFKILEVEEIFQPPGIIFKPMTQRSIVTDASFFHRETTDEILKAIPGIPVHLGVSTRDDFNHTVQATLTAFMRRNTSIKIDSEFSCITEFTIKLTGEVNATGELVLQTTGSRKISLVVRVELQACPPGFSLNEKSECVCNSEDFIGIETCTNSSALLTQGFWAGHIDDAHLGTSICPVGFCRYNNTRINMGVVVLPENSLELEEAVCGQTRQGILCGKCQAGYTTFYHSLNLNCKKAGPFSCKLGWLFYILSELIPVTLLFMFVLVLNISFTTGAVNGFILFSQLLNTLHIDASGVIKFPGSITELTRGYQIIYGFFTLDFFTIEPLSFCLWKDATVLDMLFFKYATVAYSLFLVILVILFMKYKAAKCLGRYYSITALRNSVIHGLSGFLVLTYAQCIKVSFSILYGQDISLGKRVQNTHQHLSTKRVFFNGDIEYMSSDHLAYAIPAILILLVIGVFPPFVLLGQPLLNKAFITLRMEKVWFAKCLIRTSKLKPLLDSFQGSFKDNFRFFAGIYFFYRWLTPLTYAVVSLLSLFYTVVQALLIIILVVHSVCQPYHKRWHNILDTLLFADLVVINGLTSLNYYSIRVDGQTHHTTLRMASMSIQVLLIYLPLIYITLYAIACVLGRTYCKTVKDEPSKEDFVLKKIGKRIYHSSFSGSSTLDESLPYRLANPDDDTPFEDSMKDKSEIVNTYF